MKLMTPRTRKLMLTIHITISVGWIGTVIAYLALVVAAFNLDVQTLRLVWMAFKVISWFAIAPLSLISLVTGIIMALGTKWGLFRHYWVLISLALTVFANVILLQHMQTVKIFADIAAQMNNPDVKVLKEQLQGELLHSAVGLLILLIVQVINVYKPRGLTPFGWRKQRENPSLQPEN